MYQGQPGRPSLALCSQEEWRNENLWGVEGRTGDSRGFRFVLLFVFFPGIKVVGKGNKRVVRQETWIIIPALTLANRVTRGS